MRTDGSFAPLSAGKVPTAHLGSGTASNGTFLRGDGVWAAPAGGGSSSLATLTDTTISSPSNNQTLLYDTASAKWRNQPLPSAPVSSVNGQTGVVSITKADVGLPAVDNTADNAKSVASAAKLTTARMINGVSFDGTTNITVSDSTKAADAAVVHNSGNETVAGIKTFSSSPVVPTPTDGTQAANKSYVDAATPTIADASTSTKGAVQLSGDLAGTAAAPTVPGLRVTDANIFWDGTGSCPLRASVTSDTLRRVRWISPVSPPTTTGYALPGDIWEAVS